MADVSLLINKSQKKSHLEPHSGMYVREIKKMAVLEQITERVAMSIHLGILRQRQTLRYSSRNYRSSFVPCQQETKELHFEI